MSLIDKQTKHNVFLPCYDYWNEGHAVQTMIQKLLDRLLRNGLSILTISFRCEQHTLF